jgi:hypothetical protein
MFPLFPEAVGSRYAEVRNQRIDKADALGEVKTFVDVRA